MVDVSDEFVISVNAVRKAVTNKTKAIIPVDIAGWPCDNNALLNLVNEPGILRLYKPDSEIQQKLNRILILSDSAHSFGASQNGVPSVSISDISIFSLHAVKNLTTAEGGAICLNLPEPFDNGIVYKYLRMMTLNGQTKDAYSKTVIGGWKYDIVMQGMKINMPDICAAIGLAQIKKYGTIMIERKRVFERYSRLLKEYPWAQLPPQDNNIQTSSYHLYALRLYNITEAQRDLMITDISNSGISVNVHFIPMPMLSLFKEHGYKIEDFPIAYDNYSREISLPIYPQLTNSQIDYIVKKVAESYLSVVETHD
jgi:dTDP-4-amino-4,6-dideoxygalactose transaminase